VAAGLFLGAAVVTHTMIAACAVAAAPLAAGPRRGDRACGPGPSYATASSSPAWSPSWPRCPSSRELDFTVSPGERAWLADHLATHYAQRLAGSLRAAYPLAVLRYVVGSLNDAFLAVSLLGLGLA
jgi:hypothetical protein